MTKRIASESAGDDASCHSVEDDKVDTAEEQKLIFVKEIMSTGISEVLARKALEFVSPDRVNDGELTYTELSCKCKF